MMNQPTPLNRFTPRWDVLFLSLNSLSSLMLNGTALGAALRVLRVADAPVDVLSTEVHNAIVGLELLPPESHPEWRRAHSYLEMLVRHKRTPDEHLMLYNIIDDAVSASHRQEVLDMALTIAETDVARGRLEGQKEGRQEGQLLLIVDQLETKFGVNGESMKHNLAEKS